MAGRVLDDEAADPAFLRFRFGRLFPVWFVGFLRAGCGAVLGGAFVPMAVRIALPGAGKVVRLQVRDRGIQGRRLRVDYILRGVCTEVLRLVQRGFVGHRFHGHVVEIVPGDDGCPVAAFRQQTS